MKTVRTALLFLAAASFLVNPLRAQEGAKPDAKAQSNAHAPQLKVQMVFTEFDGDKKTKSMPYTLGVRRDRAADRLDENSHRQPRPGLDRKRGRISVR